MTKRKSLIKNKIETPPSTRMKSLNSTAEAKEDDRYASSDEEDLRNTIGNVPIEWYDDYEHIGYDLRGQKILKPGGKSKDEIDTFLERMEDPDYW